MIDRSLVEGFDCDDGNSRKSLDKHGIAQTEAEQVFVNEPVLAEDVDHSRDEPRFRALGETIDGRYLHVTFTMRYGGRRIRIISARDMNRKERAIYEQTS